MTASAAAALLAAGAVLVLPHRRARVLRRLDDVQERPAADRPGRVAGPAGWPGRPLSAWAWRPVAGAALLAVVAGRGVMAAALLVAAVAVAGRGRRAAGRAALEHAQVACDLPRAADLLAACLDAGATVPAALRIVADVVPGPLAGRLRPAAALLQSGGDPAGLPAARLDDDPAARLLRALARAARTGAPLADLARDLADDERERARGEALQQARRAGVRAVGPLAACFLPAFVLIGVVPVVVGVAGTVLGGLA